MVPEWGSEKAEGNLGFGFCDMKISRGAKKSCMGCAVPARQKGMPDWYYGIDSVLNVVRDGCPDVVS